MKVDLTELVSLRMIEYYLEDNGWSRGYRSRWQHPEYKDVLLDDIMATEGWSNEEAWDQEFPESPSPEKASELVTAMLEDIAYNTRQSRGTILRRILFDELARHLKGDT